MPGLKHALKRISLILTLATLALYIGDNLTVRFRIWTNRTPFGSIPIKRYLAIRHKDQRVEFVPADGETRPCVNALFPQFGNNPCWFVSRNTVERIEL